MNDRSRPQAAPESPAKATTDTVAHPADVGPLREALDKAASLTDFPCGRAHAGPPVPGRTLWAITVLTCPRCGGMHQHRAGKVSRLLSGRLDRICPTTGKPYRLAPVQRRREARRA